MGSPGIPKQKNKIQKQQNQGAVESNSSCGGAQLEALESNSSCGGAKLGALESNFSCGGAQLGDLDGNSSCGESRDPKTKKYLKEP